MTLAAQIAAAFAIGCVFGLVYFAALWRSVDTIGSGTATASHLVVAAVLRLAAALVLIAAMFHFQTSVVGIAAACAGFLASRAIALRMARRPCRPFVTGGKTHGH